MFWIWIIPSIILGIIIFISLSLFIGRYQVSPFTHSMNKVKGENVLTAMTNELVLNNIPYFAYAETLLGCMRHEGYIPWSEDMTLVVPHKDKKKVVELSRRIKSRYGHTMNEEDLICHFYKKGHPSIRLLFSEQIGDELRIAKKSSYPVAEIFPLRTMFFESKFLIIPKEPNVILEKKYGSEWKEICQSKGKKVPCSTLSTKKRKLDKVYVINLDKRSDKWSRTEKRLQEKGFTPVRWSASGKEDADVQTARVGNRSLGETGCSMSHFKLIDHLYKNNVEYAFIVEDDIIFADDVTKDDIELEMMNSPGFGLLYIGYCGVFPNRTKTPKVGGVMCTHAYIISRHGMEKILSNIRFDIPIDKVYRNLCENDDLLCYISGHRRCSSVKTTITSIADYGMIHQDDRNNNDIRDR